MKRIYLDWGVVSYSPAHLEDLMKSKGEPQFESDIRMLSDLAEDHLLDIDKGVVLPYRVTTITRYFGLEGICDYESLRKKFVEGKRYTNLTYKIDGVVAPWLNKKEKDS